LRSCHAGRWRFFKNRPDVITSGRFYFADDQANPLPYYHDFYSSTWTKGDEYAADATGPIQEQVGPWNAGDLDISFPPGIPYGDADQFSGELSYPDDTNNSRLRAGIPEACWTSVGAPFVPADDVTNILNCCVRTAYGQLLKWLYDAEFQKFKDWFLLWIGPTAAVTTYAQIGLRPAMAIVTTDFFNLVFVTGTTNFQQLATQAWQAKLGPSSFGAFRTLQLWFDLATLLSERLSETLANVTVPTVYVGHSYGAAGCAVACMREKAAGFTQPLFLLTFGMPKPADNPGIRLLDTVRTVHVWNEGDIVSQLPINVIQSSWFPGFVSDALANRWGLWSAAPEYRRQALNGTTTLGHLPALTGDELIDPIVLLSLGLPLDQILSHPIREYILRSCRGCNCPRWPLPVAVWNALEIGACGRRGFRFRVAVPPVMPAHEPRARFRFAVQVVNFPAKPPLCLSACLHLATTDELSTSTVGLFGNATKFSTAFFVKRRASGGVLGFVQYVISSEKVISHGLYLDDRFYFHVPTAGGYSYGSVPVPADLNWHHLAAVFDGSITPADDRLSLYVDGVEQFFGMVGTFPATSAATGGPMTIAGLPFYGSNNQNADVRFILGFDYALSAHQVEKLASNTINPYALEPAWFVPFTEGEGLLAKDYSGNGHDLAFTASTTWCGLCLPMTTARLKFRVDVQQAGWDGIPIALKFRFRAELHNPTPPGDAVPVKFKFRVLPYVSPLPPASKSIWMNAAFSQSQTYENSPLMGNAFSVFFWARSVPATAPGSLLSFSNFFPRLFRASISTSTNNYFQIDLIKPPAFIGETFSASAILPKSMAWHFYVIELFDVPTHPEPAKLWMDAVERPLTSSYYPPTFTNAWFGAGMFRVGTDGFGGFKSGYYKNVGVYDGIWTAEEKAAIMACEIDLASAGADRLFEYEDDVGADAWETITAQLTDGFNGFPAHVPNVPPFMT